MISLQRIQELGGQELSILTAEWVMGWEEDGALWRDSNGDPVRKISDWHPVVDLNAVQEMEQKMTKEEQDLYLHHVENFLRREEDMSLFQLATAPAKIRARAALAAFLHKTPVAP